MGLIQCFEAAEVLPYAPFDGVDGGYYPHLITPPRVYEEEPLAYTAGSDVAILWSEQNRNPYGDSVIQVYSMLNTNDAPSWRLKRWRIDGTGGRVLDQAYISVASIALWQNVATEPSGQLWEFRGVNTTGAILIDPETLAANTSVQLLPTAFSGHSSDYFADFAISRADDRVWVRWGSESRGTVRVYRWSDKSLLHNIYSANQTNGIVLTHDGFVFVVDKYDWIQVYDFDGNYYGGMKNGRTASYPAGFVYGWDKFYKRLLFLGGTAHEADGASTLRPKGFYPVPKETVLMPAIPRSVPRKGKVTYFFSHLCGDGGEPIAGKRVIATNAATGTHTTDAHGDIAVPVTPPTTASVTLDLEAP